ncbi:MAG: SLBB domain-containing protein [Chitinophagaceae bacterium]
MKHFITINRLFLAVVIVMFGLTANAQDLLRNTNLSTIKVDQISDADILKYRQQLRQNKISDVQAEQIALARGFPPAEFEKLKVRLAKIGSVPEGGSSSAVGNDSKVTGERAQVGTPITDPAVADPIVRSNAVFGSEIFTNPSLSFEPNLKIATPSNYELGADDVIQILVYGMQEGSYELTVSTEGSVYIQNVGLIKVGGLTIEAATQKIKQTLMSSVYGTLKSGASKMSLTLSRIRSIRITVIGAVKPGTYTVSSLATLFNALYLSGGPNEEGTYRNIELIRNGKVEKRVDIYSFLTKGDLSDNVRLRDNDLIRIPTYDRRVKLVGEVKKQGVFELKKGETFANLIEYAQGFTTNAYRASVKVTQLTDKEKRFLDIKSEAFATYVPQAGDVIEVGKVLDRFENRITITGAVFRPGEYALTEGMTVASVIAKADGIREDAYAERGLIVRTNADLTKSAIPFTITEVMNGTNNPILQREDVVQIISKESLNQSYFIDIQGEVKKPGIYPYLKGMKLKDLILLAEGFTDAAYAKKIEIARFISRDTLTNTDVRSSEIIILTNTTNALDSIEDVILKPKDIVVVKRQPGYLLPQTVVVTGEVVYPGKYAIASRNERISDLLKRVGGFTNEAFTDGAYLKRNKKELTLKDQAQLQTVSKIQEQLKDTTQEVYNQIIRNYDQIPLDINYIFAHPGSPEDILLEADDLLFIPRFDAQIRITGEVLFPTQVPFSKEKHFKTYVSDAGGFTDAARIGKSYVVYANGKASNVKHFLFFKKFPKVKPGCEIIIPKTVERARKKISTAETIGLSSAIASLAAVVIAILNTTK